MSEQVPVDEAGDLVAFFQPALGNAPPGLCAGMLVAVPDGAAEVSALGPADMVIGPNGVAAPVVWLARRGVRGEQLHDPRWLPIVLSAGCLSSGIPTVDIKLSPATLLWLDGALYPAGALTNGTSIRQEAVSGQVEYCLPVANATLIQVCGVAISSLDDWSWLNAYGNAVDSPTVLSPFQAKPRATAPMLVQMRNRLAARGRIASPRLTHDRELRLWIAGTAIQPEQREGSVYTFNVPVGAQSIRLLSRSAVPAAMPNGGSDERRLGVCVSKLTLRNADLTLDIQPASGLMSDGFHPPGPNGMHTWTDGFALIPPHLVALMEGAFELTVHLVDAPLRYLDPPSLGVPTALVLDASLPTPDRDAGSNVMVEHIKLLQSLGFAVTFVPVDNFARIEPYASALEAMGVEVVHRKWYDHLAHFLAERGSTFKVAYVHRLTVAETAIPLLRQIHPSLPIIYNTADLHHLRRQRYATLRDDPKEAETATVERDSELAAVAAADVTLLCNTHEVDLVRQALPGSRLVYLPWVRDLVPTVRPGWAERAGIMFLGGFQHPPNVDAMMWFVNEVMPELRVLGGGLSLTIYGADLPPDIAALAADDIVIGGYVPDLHLAFDRHRVSIAPLRYGAGFKGKVAESLAHGVPIVATPVAAEGTGLEDGINILVASDPASMASSIVRLYHDEAFWQLLADAGRDYVATALSPDAGRNLLKRSLADIGVLVSD